MTTTPNTEKFLMELERGRIPHRLLCSVVLPHFEPGEWIASEGKFFYYIPEEHRYTPVAIDKLKSKIMDILEDISPQALWSIDPYKLKSIIDVMFCDSRYFREPSFWDPLPEFLNSTSGVIDIRTGEDVTASRKFWPFRYCLQANYLGEQMPATPAFDRFCRTSLNDQNYPEQQTLLLEMMGYALSDDFSGKCALFFLGAPNSGKSVMLRFLNRLFGSSAQEGMVSNVDLHQLGNRFNRYFLCAAKLNLVGEIASQPLKSIEVFKSVTGGDTLLTEMKRATPEFLRPRCKLLFAGNVLPPLNDTDPTDAFLNRVVPLIFPRSITVANRDFGLEDALWEERDGIFTRVVHALRALGEHGFTFSLSALSEEFLKMYRSEMNSFKQFLDDHTVRSYDNRVSSAEFFDTYEEYCKVNRLSIMPMSYCYTILGNMEGIEAKKMRINGQSIRGIKGLKIVADTAPYDYSAFSLEEYYDRRAQDVIDGYDAISSWNTGTANF